MGLNRPQTGSPRPGKKKRIPDKHARPGRRRPSAKAQGGKEARKRIEGVGSMRSGRSNPRPAAKAPRARSKTPATMRRGGRLTATAAEARGHPPAAPNHAGRHGDRSRASQTLGRQRRRELLEAAERIGTDAPADER